MTVSLNFFLYAYFFAFVLFCIILRNIWLYRKFGINAIQFGQQDGAQSITGIYFKLLPLASFAVLLLWHLKPALYQELGAITALEIAPVRSLGIIFLCFSLVWVIIAQAQMGSSWRIGIDKNTCTEFITNGLFQFSRNPIFVGMMAMALGYFLVLPHALTLGILVLNIALIQVQEALEEEHLLSQHGEVYVQYCKEVRRWL